MARYHVTPKGDPGVCRAQYSCPYGSLETDHFDSADEARKAYEEGKLSQTFATLRKTTDQVLASSAQTVERISTEEELVSDDELLAAVQRAGWPVFDPALGEEQFAEVAPLTDEAMAEMDAYYSAHPSVEAEEANGTHTVRVNGEPTFVTADRREVEAAKRVAESGQWVELQAVTSSGKYSHLRRYLAKDMDYLADAQLDYQEAVAARGEDKSPATAEARRLEVEQLKLVEIAMAVKVDEQMRSRAEAWLPKGEEPPF